MERQEPSNDSRRVVISLLSSSESDDDDDDKDFESPPSSVHPTTTRGWSSPQRREEKPPRPYYYDVMNSPTSHSRAAANGKMDDGTTIPSIKHDDEGTPSFPGGTIPRPSLSAREQHQQQQRRLSISSPTRKFIPSHDKINKSHQQQQQQSEYHSPPVPPPPPTILSVASSSSSFSNHGVRKRTARKALTTTTTTILCHHESSSSLCPVETAAATLPVPATTTRTPPSAAAAAAGTVSAAAVVSVPLSVATTASTTNVPSSVAAPAAAPSSVNAASSEMTPSAAAATAVPLSVTTASSGTAPSTAAVTAQSSATTATSSGTTPSAIAAPSTTIASAPLKINTVSQPTLTVTMTDAGKAIQPREQLDGRLLRLFFPPPTVAFDPSQYIPPQRREEVPQEGHCDTQSPNGSVGTSRSRKREFEYDEIKSFIDTVTDRFANDPDKQTAFLTSIAMYHYKRSSVKEMLEQVAPLLQDHPDFVQKFRIFLPLWVHEQAFVRQSHAGVECDVLQQNSHSISSNNSNVAKSPPQRPLEHGTALETKNSSIPKFVACGSKRKQTIPCRGIISRTPSSESNPNDQASHQPDSSEHCDDLKKYPSPLTTTNTTIPLLPALPDDSNIDAAPDTPHSETSPEPNTENQTRHLPDTAARSRAKTTRTTTPEEKSLDQEALSLSATTPACASTNAFRGGRGRSTSATRKNTRRFNSSETTTTERENQDSTVKDAEDIKVWRETILPLLQYCDECTSCCVEPCQQCRLCKFVPVASSPRRSSAADEAPTHKRLKTSRRYCLFNCCSEGNVTKALTSRRTRASRTSPATNDIIFQLCDRQKVYQWYRNEISKSLKQAEKERDAAQSPDSFLFDVDMEVYCLWPENNKYYEAKIVNRFLGGCVSARRSYPLYSVWFTDGSGDRRHRVPERDILTTYQMNLLLEADRLDDILNEYSKASESMFADCLRDNDEGSRRTTRAKLKSEPTNNGTEAVVEAVDASFDGTTSTDGCTTLTDTSVSSVIVLDVGKLRGRHKLPETFREKRKLPEVTSMDSDTIDDGLGNSIDFTPDENNCQRRKAQHRANAYSQMKRVGARCYAQWPVDKKSFYWGFITKVIRKGVFRTYSVRFDDGEECDDIHSEHVFSEAEYRRLERKDPPKVAGRAEVAKNHPLYGLGFCRKWIDVSGCNRTTFGKIGTCEEAFDDPSNTLFEVQYRDDEIICDSVSSPMKVDYVAEHIAWGGHLTYLAEINPTTFTVPENLPFFVKWIVPDRRFYDDKGQLFIEIRGFRLQMTAEKSSIPGAGLGLMLRIWDISGSDRTNFVLSQGELLCIGCYGPLNAKDEKSTTVFETKSFIHDYEPECYVFERTYENKNEFIDITNDSDGELHDLAKKNLMCRVNEVGGGVNEIPCVCADKDPSGSIQYHIGHGLHGHGNLTIPVETPHELKIDYGELYERQRLRFGYPRIQGEKLAAMKHSLKTVDVDQVRDFSREYSPKDIHDSLVFLESLFCPTWDATLRKKQRALTCAIVFRSRIIKLKNPKGVMEADDASWDGYEDIKKNKTVDRAIQMVQTLCDSIGSQRQIQEAILSCPLLKQVVADYIFQGDDTRINKMQCHPLYHRIVQHNV